MDGKEYIEIYNYISYKKYPDNTNLNERRTIRRKCEKFKIKFEELHYICYDKKAKENVEKLVVHCDKLDAVLFICHDESGCHLGFNKTVSKITSKYYFPNIITLIIIFIAKLHP